MTPKTKAKELVEKCKGYVHLEATAKELAKLNADEVINTLQTLGGVNDMHIKYAIKHWQWVKQEIDSVV